jgi:predicted transcriptional regulator
MSDTTTPKKVGRPEFLVNWPDSSFTVDSLKVLTGLSKVTLYLKVKQALKQNLIKATDKEKTPQGRPRIVFSKVQPTESAATTPAQPAVAS